MRDLGSVANCCMIYGGASPNYSDSRGPCHCLIHIYHWDIRHSQRVHCTPSIMIEDTQWMML